MQTNIAFDFNQFNLNKIFFANFFLILGITLKKFHYNIFLFFILCFIVIYFVNKSTKEQRYHFIYPFIFLIGSLFYNLEQNRFNFFLNEIKKNNISCIGNITEIQNNKYKNIIYFKINKIKKNNLWQDCSNYSIKIILDKKTDIKNIETGDLIEAKNLEIKFGNKFLLENLKKNDLAGFTKPSMFDYQLISRSNYSVLKFFKNLRSKIISKIKPKVSKKTFALFASIFLGKKDETKELYILKKIFNNWGLAHYLARSGLHLVMIFFIWFFLISLLPISYLNKQKLIFFVIILYSILSWESIPFIRSLIMFVIYKLCIFFNWQVNSLYCINLVCLIMLLCKPSQVFYLDFQLSFILTFALIWISTFQNKDPNY